MEWTYDEISYLINNYPNISNKELCEILKRNKWSIRSKASSLKLKKSDSYIGSDGRDWSTEEIDFIKNNYIEMRNEDISKYLNRTIKSVIKKAHILGLKKSRKHKSNMIGKRNKSVGRDLSYNFLKEIALKYKSRVEFQMSDNSSYQASRKMGILDEICSHMIKQSFSIPQMILKSILSKLLGENFLYNTRQIIKPYELDIYFPEYYLAFEYNGKGWHINDSIDKEDICEKKGIKLFTIVENNRKYEEDIKMQLIRILPNLNIITNKKILQTDIHSIIIDEKTFDGIIDEEYIISICSQYTDYSKFRKERIGLYNKLIKIKSIDKYTNHMTRKLSRWDDSKAITEIQKYVFLGDLIEKSPGCYQWVKRHHKEHLLKNLKLKNNRSKQ